MKRTAIYASAAILAAMCFSSCWKDEVVRAGADRHQASSFSATAGDECVALEWSLPEGILADDFIIRYTDENSETVTINTGAVYSLTVSELKNDHEYNFSLQAVSLADKSVADLPISGVNSMVSDGNGLLYVLSGEYDENWTLTGKVSTVDAATATVSGTFANQWLRY